LFIIVPSLAIELPKKREEILEQLEAAQSEARKVLDVIENPDVVAALRQDKLQNLQFLKDNYGVGGEYPLSFYFVRAGGDIFCFCYDQRTSKNTRLTSRNTACSSL